MAKKKKTTGKKKGLVPPVGDERLMPPPGGVTVRMYRIGHGDCFLIAFAGDKPDRPAYVLIDCGYKPGSPGKINPPTGVTSAKEIVDNIKTATGGHIDVAVITHEHQDHVNGITDKHFAGIEIGEAWFAWTENPVDDLANDLRKKFKDKLLGLVAARNRLAAAGGEDKRVEMIDELLAFELGGEDERISIPAAMALLGAANGESMNKTSIGFFVHTSGSTRFHTPNRCGCFLSAHRVTPTCSNRSIRPAVRSFTSARARAPPAGTLPRPLVPSRPMIVRSRRLRNGTP
jgi:hypothetical protein